MSLQCSWRQVAPNASDLIALGFTPEEVDMAATIVVRDVVSSFVYHGRCLVVVDYAGGTLIDAELVKLSDGC